VGVSPSSSNEGAMPAKDRLGCDKEGSPPLTGDQASEGTDERSIRSGEAGTGDLALEHSQLMAQPEDLCVLGHAVHLVDADRLCKATDDPIQEGERHRWRASPNSSCPVKPPDE
jgi:hypothetical protein